MIPIRPYQADEPKRWLRGRDSNPRPSGYEPDELPGCSTPRPLAPPGGRRRRGDVRARDPSPPWGARPARRRPTLPRLGAQYHRRRGVSRPSSGRGRVWHPRHGRRAGRAPPGGGSRVARVRAAAACVLGAVEVVVSRRVVVPRGPRGPGAAAAGAGERYRAIRTGRLRASPRLHPRPIDVVVSHGPRARPGLAVGFPLRCLQRLSRPGLATRLRGWRHDRPTRGPSAPVLSY